MKLSGPTPKRAFLADFSISVPIDQPAEKGSRVGAKGWPGSICETINIKATTWTAEVIKRRILTSKSLAPIAKKRLTARIIARNEAVASGVPVGLKALEDTIGKDRIFGKTSK